MKRNGIRLGIRTNHTVKFCVFCEEQNDNCTNDRFEWVDHPTLTRYTIGLYPPEIEGIRYYRPWRYSVEKENPINIRRNKFICKNSHGRCNSCTGYDGTKSTGKNKGERKKRFNWLKKELIYENIKAM